MIKKKIKLRDGDTILYPKTKINLIEDNNGNNLDLDNKLQPASSQNKGVISVGENLSIDNSGQLTFNQRYIPLVFNLTTAPRNIMLKVGSTYQANLYISVQLLNDSQIQLTESVTNTTGMASIPPSIKISRIKEIITHGYIVIEDSGTAHVNRLGIPLHHDTPFYTYSKDQDRIYAGTVTALIGQGNQTNIYLKIESSEIKDSDNKILVGAIKDCYIANFVIGYPYEDS